MFENKEIFLEEPVLEARHVSRVFPAADGRFLRANNDINLKMYRGRTLGIVGESGCGKSTLMRMLVQLDQPTEGEILFQGKNIGTLTKKERRENRRHIQMVFQDPSSAFNPKMKIKDIICEPLLNFGVISKKEKDAEARRLLRLVELPEEFADRHPHNMSGGQRQRVGIARAIALEPEVILCDEATSALDVSVQKNIMELLAKLQREKNIAIGFICHDIALVSQISHQIAVMYLGNVVEVLPGAQMKESAKHPYSVALLGSIFDTNMDFSQKIESIDSEIPSPLDVPPGCPFQNRCEHCMEICRKERPMLRKIGERHEVACHLFEEKEGGERR